jgi:hypothetical protein
MAQGYQAERMAMKHGPLAIADFLEKGMQAGMGRPFAAQFFAAVKEPKMPLKKTFSSS